VNRDDEATRKSATDPKRGELPVYRLAHMPPLNWIPYIPIQKSPDGSIILRRARTIENAEEKQFRGRILGESVFVNEEEIPATPVSVIRRCKLAIHGSEQWELVRIADNPEAWTLKKLPSRSQTIWLGRQKKWTARQAPCNLRFDYLVE
jgi:hypothetical protein